MIFNEDQPIYVQITEWISEKILSGVWAEQSRIPSVRELGMTLAVNPHTIIKAYERLQAEEIIINKRGVGYFTCAGARERIRKDKKHSFMNTDIPHFYHKMKMLEIGISEVVETIESLKTSENENK